MAAPVGPERFRGADPALLAVVSAVWGAAYVFIRQGIVLGASPLAFAAARYALSAVAFVAIAVARRDPFPTRDALRASALVGGFLIIGLYGGLLYWGEQFTTGGYAAVLASTAPLFTVAVGYGLLPSERLGSRGLLGIAVGFAGVAVLVVPTLSGSALGGITGPAFVLGAMLSTAAGTVVLRRLKLGPQGLYQIGAQFAVAAGLLGAGTLIVPGREVIPATPGVLGALLILVALSSLVGYFAYFTLHHRVGPIRANLVAYLAPLVGVGLGTALFAEPVTDFELIGVAIVLGGVSLVLLDSARRAAGRTAGPVGK
jgi:probable blue pigment (indigoidine) exporter